MTHSSADHVLAGRTLPLTPAPCTPAVWPLVLPPALLAPTRPDAPRHGYHAHVARALPGVTRWNVRGLRTPKTLTAC